MTQPIVSWRRLRVGVAAAASVATASATTASATTQMTDQLLVNGQPVPLMTLPLDGLMLPFVLRSLVRPYAHTSCTANWRGYQAVWQVVDDRLILVQLLADACTGKPTEVPLAVLFPGVPEPIVATWYTGSLVVGTGKRLDTYPALTPGFSSYSTEQVVSGVVVREAAAASAPR